MGSPTGLMYQAAKWILKGCGCFTPETRVWTATGLVAIALIQPGDMVFALDEATGETSLRMVTEVYEREGDAPLVIVHVSSGETIETTEEHPFLVSGRWVRADRLSRGDELVGAFGCVSVVAVEHTSRLSRVHNLEVEGLHNYRVGPDGVVVHNGKCNLWRWGLDKAHVLQPKHNWNSLFGGANPSWTKVKQALERAVNEGVDSMPEPIRGSRGKIIGVQIERVLSISGKYVVASLTKLDGETRWILKNGWVR